MTNSPTQRARGILPDALKDESVILIKACSELRLTYELRLATIMAQQSRRPTDEGTERRDDRVDRTLVHRHKLRADEIPVFWACGVTPQAVAMEARLPAPASRSPSR